MQNDDAQPPEAAPDHVFSERNGNLKVQRIPESS